MLLALQELDVGYNSGFDRLLLQYPAIIIHKIKPSSPLAFVKSQHDLQKYQNTEITLVVEGYMLKTSANVVRTISYNVAQHVRWGHAFAPCVRPAGATSRPSVCWKYFHSTYNKDGGD